MNKLIIALLAICMSIPATLSAQKTTKNNYSIEEFGVLPNTSSNTSEALVKAIEFIKQKGRTKHVTLTFPKGRYNFYPEGAFTREYYISNHDQDNPKKVGFALEELKNITIDGQGSDFIFHGRMLPISLVKGKNITLKNFSIDFEKPHIAQVKIIANDTQNKVITYEVAPWVDFEVREGKFLNKGLGWEINPEWGIAFEGDTKRLVYRTSDIGLGTKNVELVGERTIKAPWNNERLIPGTVVVMRGYGRPTPGIFVTESKNTHLENIQIHYAEGMGLLAQMSENIYMDKFSVCLRGENDPRYFTTQADATHFSGCKGKIISRNGLYEGMMDDAINVHGTYLKVVKRVNNRTLQGKYMHPQTWGFLWGEIGNEVSFVKSNTMEIIGNSNRIKAIKAVDKPTEFGAKLFEIEFEKELDAEISENEGFGIENLTWTPKVVFANNIIRNNRARGTLFSTPKKTIVENNLFDHTSGTAILLCGDCNGWYETGACRDVVIRNNKFINSLTMMFQFTNGIISIYPEIPNLKDQVKYFHGGKKRSVKIENNYFETFDNPIIYAKSINGLTFKNNTIKKNYDYPEFHFIKSKFFFERIINFDIKNNKFSNGFDPTRDIINK